MLEAFILVRNYQVILAAKVFIKIRRKPIILLVVDCKIFCSKAQKSTLVADWTEGNGLLACIFHGNFKVYSILNLLYDSYFELT